MDSPRSIADPHCIGCLYYKPLHSGCRCCHYIFMNNHMRPCKPGKDCTVKIGTKVKRKKAEKYG